MLPLGGSPWAITLGQQVTPHLTTPHFPARPQRDDILGGILVLSDQRVRLQLPPLLAYNIRLAETVTVSIPGSTLKTYETIAASEAGSPANLFILNPDNVSATVREVLSIDHGETLYNAMPYFSEQWYTVDPADAALVLRLEAHYDSARQMYGALELQIYEDLTLLPAHYANCNGPSLVCGDGSVNADGTRSCRCIRDDIENGRPPDYLLLGSQANDQSSLLTHCCLLRTAFTCAHTLLATLLLAAGCWLLAACCCSK